MAKEKRIGILKQANKLFRQGKIDGAIKEYNKILALKPDDLEVRRILGDLYLRQNSQPDAIKQFEWIADYYLKEGFFAKAIAMFKRITRLDPNYEKASFKLAELYTKQGLIIEAKQIYLDLADEYKRQHNQKKSLDMYKKILEFDRNNIKMRLLLADNYFKEELADKAIAEYATAADILMNKKDYVRAEEILVNTLSKVKEPKLVDKLVNCYIHQGKEDQAIGMLNNLGPELFNNVDLLKNLGEIYFNRKQIDEAEKIFARIAEINPGETEVIMKLGKVYLQREDYDRTYNLFLPVIDKNIQNEKLEEAASLLRFIIASKNTYLPALNKLASIFELSGKTSNLIALYESLIPIYERQSMRDELIEILEKLIKLSDNPFTYEEQLARIIGEKEEEEVVDLEEAQIEKERTFVEITLQSVDQALANDQLQEAVIILVRAKAKAPHNINLSVKLFEVYSLMKDWDGAVDEGKELLEMYQNQGLDEESPELLEKLSAIRPEDEKLVEMSGEERTNIDIDFGKKELAEQMAEINNAQLHEVDFQDPMELDSGDVLLLSDADNVTDSRESIKKGMSKSFSSLLSELDFYINDGYFGDAGELIEKLRQSYPANDELLKRVEKFEKARKKATGDAPEAQRDYQAEDSKEDVAINLPMPEEDFAQPGDTDAPMPVMDVPPEPLPTNMVMEDDLPDLDEFGGGVDLAPPPQPVEESTADLDLSDFSPPPDSFEEPALHEQTFQIESNSAGEQPMDNDFGDLDEVMAAPPMEEEPAPAPMDAPEEPLDAGFEIEMEEPETPDHVSLDQIDKEQLVQSPSVGFRELANEEFLSSAEDAFDLDQVIYSESGSSEPVAQAPVTAAAPQETPFKAFDDEDFGLGQEEDLLSPEGLMFEDDLYYEVEKQVAGELEAIAYWLKELEKQRTSTIEKNMMEIFDEFKKGIDEKIGQEDYDTRYNLGIAYKEMGLIEEAIHEFLISAKHPAKFFDSAGLLGMCFREKGMLNEGSSWFEKALEAPGRTQEEYNAIKYELVVTMKLKGDFPAAVRIIEDILRVSPDYRDVAMLHEDLRTMVPGT